MNFMKLKHNNNDFFNGPIIFETNVFKDSRGLFFESWNKKLLNFSLGNDIKFVQDNISISSRGVIRGIHFQSPNCQQGKLVRCIKGSIFDVIVDLRVYSKTFKFWGGIELNSKNNYQLWVPPGFGHGFLSYEDESIIQYKVTHFWSKENERTLIWNDKLININWPIIESPYNLSEKDSYGDTLDNLYMKQLLFK